MTTRARDGVSARRQKWRRDIPAPDRVADVDELTAWMAAHTPAPPEPAAVAAAGAPEESP